jgi:flavin-dependent dehydrogenase
VLSIGVIGGGPAGSLCAHRLARFGHRVILIDAGDDVRPAETCPSGVVRGIEAMLGAPMPDDCASRFDALRVSWGSPALGHGAYGSSQGGGAVLDRARFDRWLRAAAMAAGVEVRSGERVVAAACDGQAWQLGTQRVDGCGSIEVGFAVDATGAGARSPLQPQATRLFTDRLVCLSAEFANHDRDQPAALVEACPWGWWYAALTPAARRIINLFVDGDCTALKGDRAAFYRDALQASLHVRQLVADTSGLEIRMLAARSSVRRVLWRDRWIAIGDAARTIDPLSGGGIGRAAADAVRTAAAISQALRSRDDRPLRACATRRAEGFRQDLVRQRAHYRAEARWPDGAFWKRRA